MKCKGFVKLGNVNNNSVLYPLVENCPYKAKIEESLGQFILFVHEEPTAVNHKKDKAKYLNKEAQEFAQKVSLVTAH